MLKMTVWYRVVWATIGGLLLFAVAVAAFDHFLVEDVVHYNVFKRINRAERGDVESQYILGINYLNGGAESRSCGWIPQDNQRAVFWLGAASRSGYTKAYAPYAQALKNAGHPTEASVWKRKADAAGHAVTTLDLP